MIRFLRKRKIKCLCKQLKRKLDKEICYQKSLEEYDLEGIVIPSDFNSNHPSLILYKGEIAFIIKKQPWSVAIVLIPSKYNWLETNKETSTVNDIGYLCDIREHNIPNSIVYEMEKSILRHTDEYFGNVNEWIKRSQNELFGNS